MSIAKEIAPHLPYLRRFARALSGTQASGDAYVVEMLEALVADPSAFPREFDSRIGLYRTFLKLWSSVGLNTSDAASVEIGRSAGRAQSRSPDAASAAGLPAAHRRGFLDRRRRGHHGRDVGRGRRPRPDGRTGDRRAGRHRCADHRGRTDHRARHRDHGRGTRPHRDRRRPDPAGGDRARRQEAPRPRARRYPARRRQLRPRCGERDPRPRSTCR